MFLKVKYQMSYFAALIIIDFKASASCDVLRYMFASCSQL